MGAHRAQAVAAAWGGSIDQSSLCPRERRLSSVGTKLSCQIRADAFAEGANAVAAVLGTQTFSDQIQSRIANVVGNSGAALQGDVTFTKIAAWRGHGELGAGDADLKSSPSWIVWTIACVAGVLLLLLAGCLVARRRKGNSGHSTGEQAVWALCSRWSKRFCGRTRRWVWLEMPSNFACTFGGSKSLALVFHASPCAASFFQLLFLAERFSNLMYGVA